VHLGIALHLGDDLFLPLKGCFLKDEGDTVGRNPAPIDMVNIPLFTGFHTCQVVQDFVHQRYL